LLRLPCGLLSPIHPAQCYLECGGLSGYRGPGRVELQFRRAAGERESGLRSAWTRLHGWLHLGRTVLWGFVAVVLWLRLDGFVAPGFAAAALVMGLGAGVAAWALRLRVAAALAVVAGLAVAFRVVALGVLSGMAATADSHAVRALPFAFDTGFWPALPLFFVVAAFSYGVRRRSGVVAPEVGVAAVAVAALFWDQAHYQLTLFGHPIPAAGFVTAFLACCLAVLALERVGSGLRGGSVAVSGRTEFRGRRSSATGSRASRLLRSGASAVPLVLILAAFLGGFLYRYNEQAVRGGGGLMRPSGFRFDFADYLRLESDITQSEDLVLLFRTDAEPERRLLRRYVLSGYDPRRGFYRDEAAPDSDRHAIEMPPAPRELDMNEYRARSEIEQELYIVNFDPGSVMALNEPAEVVPYRSWDDSSFVGSYRVTSEVSAAYPFQLERSRAQEADGLSAEAHAHYTDYAGDRAVAELAREVSQGAENDFERADRIEQFFLDEYYYSHSPGVAADGNQLHHFLFDARKGYCSYFAFGMALMLRSLDIPARVAVGFYVEPGMSVMNFYPVRGNMAHAWVEVYFEEYGWIEFDPTSRTPAPGETIEPPAPTDFDRLSGLLEEILAAPRVAAEEPADAAGWDRGADVLGRAARGAVGRWYLIVPLLYLGWIGAIRAAGSIPALLSRDARRRAAGYYSSACRKLAALGLRRRIGESRLEFAERVSALGIDLVPITEQRLAARFAPGFDRGEIEKTKRAFRRFREDFRGRFRWWRRLIGVLNPFVLPRYW